MIFLEAFNFQHKKIFKKFLKKKLKNYLKNYLKIPIKILFFNRKKQRKYLIFMVWFTVWGLLTLFKKLLQVNLNWKGLTALC